MVTTKEKPISGYPKEYDKGVKAYCHQKSHHLQNKTAREETRNKGSTKVRKQWQ